MSKSQTGFIQKKISFGFLDFHRFCQYGYQVFNRMKDHKRYRKHCRCYVSRSPMFSPQEQVELSQSRQSFRPDLVNHRAHAVATQIPAAMLAYKMKTIHYTLQCAISSFQIQLEAVHYTAGTADLYSRRPCPQCPPRDRRRLRAHTMPPDNESEGPFCTMQTVQSCSGSLLIKEKCAALFPAPSVTGWDTNQTFVSALPLNTCAASVPFVGSPVIT